MQKPLPDWEEKREGFIPGLFQQIFLDKKQEQYSLEISKYPVLCDFAKLKKKTYTPSSLKFALEIKDS